MDIETADTERPLVDVRDMIVVHTAILRELRLAPAAIARGSSGSTRQAKLVDRHIGLVCDLLHHHHQGEEELLWPLLRDRLPEHALPLLEQAENQHGRIEGSLAGAQAARSRWISDLRAANRDELIASLQALYQLVAEHLDAEERTLLPLAAAYLSEAEWAAIGQAGAAAVPKPKLALVFGMFAYEGDPAVLAAMLHSAPALPRLVVPRVAPRIYARQAAKMHGTPRP